MENASKALIIAGAILLAILIISLGLIVYNQAKETVGSVNLSQQEIEAFNAKFTAFEGTNVPGSQVNQLIQTVIASNQQSLNDSTNHWVGIDDQTGSSISVKKSSDGKSVDATNAKVTAGKKYSVTLSYDQGIVNEVTIDD